MYSLIKKIWDYLIEKVHITLTPSSPDQCVKRFKVRRIYPILLTIIIITSICGLGFLYKHYEKDYRLADSKLHKFKNIKTENKELKNELVTLKQDTEELRQAVVNLEEYNHNIKAMINDENKNKDKDIADKKKQNDDIDMQLRTIGSYNNNIFQQGVPMGGGDFRLLYQDSKALIKTMQANVNTIKNEIPKQRKELQKLEESAKKYNAKKASTPAIWPVADKGKGYISSDFGWRNDPTTSAREFHEGLDIAVWYNTPVMATAKGKVSFAGWASGYGWTVKIDHGFGYETIYGHLNRVKVKKGEKVNRGQVVALTGNSGRSTGPHLHYEVRAEDIPKNPRDFIGR